MRAFRILIVEDEPLIAWTLAEALEEVGFGVVGPVATAREGLAALAADPSIDGAILDGDLADGPSVPVALALRERGVPFVFHTGSGRPDILSPLAPVFRKPCSLGDVLGGLAAAMGHAGGRAA